MRKLIFLFFISFLFAESFEDFKKSQLQQFQNYKLSLEQGFKEYKEELNRGFEEYKKELSKYWKNPELTTKKKFVEYSKDKKVRKKVDYEKKTITIDVIAKNEKEAKEKIKNTLTNLVTETTKEAVNKNIVLSKVREKLKKKYPNIVAISKPSNELVVGDMVFKGKITKEKVNNFVKKSLSKPIKTFDSKVKGERVYRLSLTLPPYSILVKAKRYKSDVFKRANEFSLTPSLIYAIIHTESSYNPLARSYVPAFGLMQIVPQTAGRDAYKMLYHKEKILSPDYLYNSHNNILIGSAYLYKIYYQYFKDIKNPLSRLYCTIAAYNTGVGNVACAFNNPKGKCYRSRGDYSIKKALPKINSMAPKEVYYYLIDNLKYEEARNYVKKVMKRYILYLHSLKANKI